MRNIFLFIRRYVNVLFFLFIQGIALWFFIRYNRFHEAAFMEVATELTGGISKKFNTVEYYFKLRKTNEELVQENNRLRNLLTGNFEAADSSSSVILDSFLLDSLQRYRRWLYEPAKIVGSFVSLQTNYLMIHRGRSQGVAVDDGVVGPHGIVGRVITVSNNYASVMTVINRQFRTSVKLLKSGDRGSIEWDGSSPSTLILKDIQKTVPVSVGDTVVTSELSTIFPAGTLVGTVQEVQNDRSSNFHSIRLKTTTNFTNVEFAYVVKDLQKDEKETLEEETKKVQ